MERCEALPVDREGVYRSPGTLDDATSARCDDSQPSARTARTLPERTSRRGVLSPELCIDGKWRTSNINPITFSCGDEKGTGIARRPIGPPQRPLCRRTGTGVIPAFGGPGCEGNTDVSGVGWRWRGVPADSAKIP